MSLQHNPNPANCLPALRITRNPSEPPPNVPPPGETTGGDSDRIGGYDFTWLLIQLEFHGKQQFGDQFVIHEKDHGIIRRLVVYFLADAARAAQLGIDLAKGILLTGPVGCGKTSLMSLMQLVRRPERSFAFKSAREVSFEFIQEGYSVIHRYSRMSYTHAGPRAYCFDDLGAERALKYFGNECNVMAEVMLSRYDHYIASDMLTHLTTNLSATEIEEAYGPRLRSRMREMFNLISFDPAGDKRK